MASLTTDDEPDDYAPTIECWQCAGSGDVSGCWDDGSCFDPEYGCEECWLTCDICSGNGGWLDPAYLDAAIAKTLEGE